MEKRLLAVSDVHGCYEDLKALLKVVNYNPCFDQLVLLGDYVDRGPDSFKTVELVMNLVSKSAVALMGNHDRMFSDYITGQGNSFNYFLNGGDKTVSSYKQASKKKLIEHIEFLKGLPLYWESENFIFVHAGLNPNKKIEDQYEDDMLWIREKWLYSKDSPTDKTVVFGHSVVSHWFNCDGIYVDDYKIGINTGAGCGGYLSLVNLSEMMSYSLYNPQGIPLSVESRTKKDLFRKVAK